MPNGVSPLEAPGSPDLPNLEAHPARFRDLLRANFADLACDGAAEKVLCRRSVPIRQLKTNRPLTTCEFPAAPEFTHRWA